MWNLPMANMRPLKKRMCAWKRNLDEGVSRVHCPRSFVFVYEIFNISVVSLKPPTTRIRLISYAAQEEHSCFGSTFVHRCKCPPTPWLPCLAGMQKLSTILVSICLASDHKDQVEGVIYVLTWCTAPSCWHSRKRCPDMRCCRYSLKCILFDLSWLKLHGKFRLQFSTS